MLENIIKESKKDLQEIFNTVEDVEEYNSRKVLDAFIENKIIFICGDGVLLGCCFL